MEHLDPGSVSVHHIHTPGEPVEGQVYRDGQPFDRDQRGRDLLSVGHGVYLEVEMERKKCISHSLTLPLSLYFCLSISICLYVCLSIYACLSD